VATRHVGPSLNLLGVRGVQLDRLGVTDGGQQDPKLID